uniref:Uncharacterized protein n=1 Tax=Cannabis sativa TaxID=3483 RepID=A0A803P989_CANSA
MQDLHQKITISMKGDLNDDEEFEEIPSLEGDSNGTTSTELQGAARSCRHHMMVSLTQSTISTARTGDDHILEATFRRILQQHQAACDNIMLVTSVTIVKKGGQEILQSYIHYFNTKVTKVGKVSKDELKFAIATGVHPGTERPSASCPSAGLPSAGHPSASRPSAGHPLAGHPSAGSLLASLSSIDRPSIGSPSVGCLSVGHPLAGHPSVGPISTSCLLASLPLVSPLSTGCLSASIPQMIVLQLVLHQLVVPRRAIPQFVVFGPPLVGHPLGVRPSISCALANPPSAGCLSVGCPSAGPAHQLVVSQLDICQLTG